MQKQNILLIGGGDFAKKVIKLIEKIDKYSIVGYTDKNDRGKLFDIPYLGNDSIFERIIIEYPDCSAALCIAGNIELLNVKEKIISKLEALGFNFPSLIAPSAEIDKTVKISKGCLIFDGAYIDFETNIEPFTVINLNSTIGHNTTIGKFSVISPEVITGGGSLIGSHTFIGINSTIRPYVNITNKCIIGAGTVVTKNCDKSGTYVGNPAKLIK